MCGRFTLKTPTVQVRTLFPELDIPDLTPRYNIAPTQMVSSVRSSHDNKQQFATFRWGLVPFWSKDLKIGSKMINARGESVSSKPSFRSAFKKRRCLVLADGFFEWKKINDGKQPYYMTLEDESPFCMAGLWEKWNDKTSGETIETCTVITTEANEFMSELHDRMPVILDKSDYGVWLDNEFQDAGHLESLLCPMAEGELKKRPVNKIVNRPVNDSPECIETVSL